MFKDALKEYVLDNPKLVSMRPAGTGIFVLKYKKKVFFDDLWNEFLEECRGTIVDEDFNIVSRPFTKIYNYGIDKQSPKFADDTPVTALRKVNGFMVAMTWHNDDILVSTTGTTDSDYVKMAREFIDYEKFRHVLRSTTDFTFIFECVHPNDPHVVPEEAGLYLLGFRAKSWDSKIHYQKFGVHPVADLLGCHKVETFNTTVGELLVLSKTVKHEGFVFYTDLGEAAKIKSPYYLTAKWVARNPRTDKLMRDDIKKQIDEEYYPLIDAIRANIDEYTAMDEQTRLAWVRKFLEA